MNRRSWLLSFAAASTLLVGACEPQPKPASEAAVPALTGAWRSDVQFRTGAFAAIKDLQFMYVFNLGGTMTESSNYDGSPPVPPAYGAWKQIGANEFEAHYEFYVTAPPKGISEITGGGGWLPTGRGSLVERITLAADGKSFQSTIRYAQLAKDGKPTEAGGEATGRAVRIGI
ncbi:MAG: hypothetical protein ABI718_15385 [Acidobacteriota bacterium]